jgi:acyl dehydratase
MKLIVASTPLAGGVIGGGGEIAWPLPVRPGDRLQVESEIIAIKPSRTRPRGVVTMRSETRNQRGEIVQAATMKVIVQRRPASS